MGLSVASNNPLNSVTTILFKNRKASNDPEVLNMINNAEAVFFAGGDQSEYLKLWSDTPVQTAIQGKVKNITIGGTSAGCDILGHWIYTAEKGSVDSQEALSDPYNREMTFSTAFLNIPFLESIITDTHFVTRDRMGRMIAFLARLIQDSEEKVHRDLSCSDLLNDTTSI
jgi:cyanophycinase